MKKSLNKISYLPFPEATQIEMSEALNFAKDLRFWIKMQILFLALGIQTEISGCSLRSLRISPPPAEQIDPNNPYASSLQAQAEKERLFKDNLIQEFKKYQSKIKERQEALKYAKKLINPPQSVIQDLEYQIKLLEEEQRKIGDILLTIYHKSHLKCITDDKNGVTSSFNQDGIAVAETRQIKDETSEDCLLWDNDKARYYFRIELNGEASEINEDEFKIEKPWDEHGNMQRVEYMQNPFEYRVTPLPEKPKQQELANKEKLMIFEIGANRKVVVEKTASGDYKVRTAAEATNLQSTQDSGKHIVNEEEFAEFCKKYPEIIEEINNEIGKNLPGQGKKLYFLCQDGVIKQLGNQQYGCQNLNGLPQAGAFITLISTDEANLKNWK